MTKHRSTEWWSIDDCKNKQFEASRKDDSKNTLCPLKNPEIEIFVANNSLEKISAAENFQYHRVWTCRTVYTKTG